MSVIVGQDFAAIRGTWVFPGRKEEAGVLKTSLIHLDRRAKQGVEAIAEIHSHEDGSANLGVELINWEILRWDDDEIVAEAQSVGLISSMMTIDIKAEKVRMFCRPTGDRDYRPEVLELLSGWNVSRDFWQERQEKAMQVMAPAYREAMARMRDLLKDGADSANQTNKPVTPSTLTKGKTLDGLLIEARARQMRQQSESQKQSTPVDDNTPQGPSPKQ